MRANTLLPVGVVLAAILSLVFFPNIKGGTPMNESTAGNPIVLFETTMGDIKIELDMQNAPNTSENFLAYVDGIFRRHDLPPCHSQLHGSGRGHNR